MIISKIKLRVDIGQANNINIQIRNKVYQIEQKTLWIKKNSYRADWINQFGRGKWRAPVPRCLTLYDDVERNKELTSIAELTDVESFNEIVSSNLTAQWNHFQPCSSYIILFIVLILCIFSSMNSKNLAIKLMIPNMLFPNMLAWYRCLASQALSFLSA